jgi:predicted extracellular nuclease
MYIKRFVFFLCLAGCVIFLSCGKNKKNFNSTKELTITNWNVQTFFDVKDDGVEFDEFKTGKYWNENLYKLRLERLAGAIKEIDSDIFVMEEIENESVLKDLLNFIKKMDMREYL